MKSIGVKSHHVSVCVISDFRHGAYEIRALLESYAAYPRFGTTYRFHLQRSSSSSWAWISVACLPVYSVLQFPVGCNNNGTATPLNYCTEHFVSVFKCILTTEERCATRRIGLHLRSTYDCHEEREGKVEVHPSTCTEALYRPYGP